MIAKRVSSLSRLLWALAFVLLACSKGDEPSDPVWGKEPCAHCAMVVGDKRYAGQALVDGERRFFDDIGCMVVWMEEHKSTRAWSHDAQGGGWVDAKLGRYALGARTPMGFGVEARAGAPLEWSEMREKVLATHRNQP